MIKRVWTMAVLLSLALVWRTETVAAAPRPQDGCCEITSPRANAQLRGSVEIIGTARLGPEFQFYKVEYASSATPDVWVPIGDLHREQRTGERLETWHTSSIPDGGYYLHLVVVKLDGNFVATEPLPVQIANTQPEATPTPAETATPTPTIVMPTPTTAVVAQPTVLRVTPTATAEDEEPPTATPDTASGVSIPDLGTFVRQFVFGAFVTTVIFLLLGVVFLLRRLV